MRLVFALLASIGIILGSILVVTKFLEPPPAKERLVGVAVVIESFTIADLGQDRHRLTLQVRVTSPRDIDACLGFALDQPFGSRRLEPTTAECVKPTAGTQYVSLAFDRLTDTDVAFPGHSLVWGVAGGRCGLVFEAFGVCVVDVAGTADLQLPGSTALPSLGPIGSIFNFFSFEPLP